MQAEREDGRSNVNGNSEPRSSNVAKWAYNDGSYSGDNDINYALAMAAGGQGIEPSGLQNINEVLNNEGLNDEIKKLLSEQSNF